MAYFAYQGNKEESGKIINTISEILEINFGTDHSNNAYIFDQMARYFEADENHKLALQFLLTANKMYESLIGKSSITRVSVAVD